jgi:AAA+ ATPase superfamily predicted ATPase
VLGFVGREQELRDLAWALDQVRAALGGRAPGQCIQMRGRRRIGKSSLVEEFLQRSRVPAVYFTAERRTEEHELASFWQAVQEAPWEDPNFVHDVTPSDWSAAFRTLAAALPDDRPTVVVIDELPYLIEKVPAFEGLLQRAWDRELSRKPALLILIGSDLSMMEALNAYDRPFHQRGREMVIGPLSPAAIGDMLGLDPAAAFDAAIVTGGLPLICAEWGLPLSTRPSKERRYRITDPYLRFWLAFIEPNRALIERRRPDLALERIRRGWTTWRGRAVEPLIRDSLARVLPAQGIPDAPAVGAYWTRTNDVEIDIVGADREPVAREILFAGSIKWLENAAFDAGDLGRLHRHRIALTDDPVPLVAVSRSGATCKNVDAVFEPADLLAAWS